VEADSVDLALQLAHVGVDTLQLDKLPPEDVTAIARALGSPPCSGRQPGA
jgi:molybdenum transport protein